VSEVVQYGYCTRAVVFSSLATWHCDVWVRAKYGEITPIILSLSRVLGLLMAFIAYGRIVLRRSV
jgi:hypothetical protein